MGNTATAHLGIISIQDEYGTPVQLLSNACDEFGMVPVLDVCSNHTNRKCIKYFSLHDDALKQEWNEDFFMNPPYSKVRQFMRYAYEQHKKHNVNAMILTYAKTDTYWWHELVEGKAEVHFIKGRVKFNDRNGNITKHPAPYPSCWILWRKTL